MSGAGNDPSAAAASVGAMLREARERAGLSLDAVAQQLKLAPRQVRAIEDDDYARLPGRTFVRGFVRNYARLVRLDTDAIVGALPRGEATSPLERLTYTPGAGTIAEMPDDRPRKPSWSKWLIPLALVAIVAVAAVYEWMRPGGGVRRSAPETVPGMAPPMPAPGPASTVLPNPLESPRTESAPNAPGPASATAEPATSPPQPFASPASAAPATAAPAVPEGAAANAALVLAWTGPSWIEVKDATGTLLVSQNGGAGATQSVSGTPPFDVIVGNAANVALTWRGQPFDLAPHTRQNVARFTLR